MITSVVLPYFERKRIYEFRTSYKRTILVADFSLEKAKDCAKLTALFWDETLIEDSGKVASVAVYFEE